MTKNHSDAALVQSTEEADSYIAALVTPQLRKDVTPEFSATERNRLDDLERSNVCAWFATWGQQDYERMVQLFRPTWPPAPIASATTNPQ